MIINKKLTENLTFESVEENTWDDNDNLIAVSCYFSLFGKEAEACVVIERLDSPYPRYTMLEADSEIHASFQDLLEKDEIWQLITEEIKNFLEEWNSTN